MIVENQLSLSLQGKVSLSVLEKLNINKILQKGQIWVFADFAVSTIKLPFTFDTLFAGKDKSLVKNNKLKTIKLVKAIDQYGNILKEIPKGYKSICKLQFSPEITKEITELSLLSEFGYNPNAVTLAKHDDVKLSSYNDLLTKSLYEALYGQFIMEVSKPGYTGKALKKNQVSKKIFYSISLSKFNLNAVNSDKVLNMFVQMGKVKTSDKEIELIEVL